MTSSAEPEARTSFRGPAASATCRSSTRPARPLRQRLRLPLMIAGPVVVLLAASWWYLTSGRYVSTDDAYVQAARTMVSADVSGRVVAVEVRDNQRVTQRPGAVPARRPAFRIAVEEAKAKLAAAQLQVEALQATYHQKLADMKAAEETLAYQQREYERQRQLAATGVAPRRHSTRCRTRCRSRARRSRRRRATLANMLAQLGGNPNLPVDDHPTVQQRAGGARQGRTRPRAHGRAGRRRTASSPRSSSCRSAPTSTRRRRCSR